MKTCLITGASGGVATALAQQLRAQGWRLARVSRDAGKLAPAEGELAIEADVAWGYCPKMGNSFPASRFFVPMCRRCTSISTCRTTIRSQTKGEAEASRP